MIRRPPRSTLSSSSAASDVYKRQLVSSDFDIPKPFFGVYVITIMNHGTATSRTEWRNLSTKNSFCRVFIVCLLYTSDAADEEDSVDLGGRRIIKKKKKNKR